MNTGPNNQPTIMQLSAQAPVVVLWLEIWRRRVRRCSCLKLVVTTRTITTRSPLFMLQPTRASGTAPVSIFARYRQSFRKEVILSSGTFGTLQLLKLSGVGPREELKHFGIQVRVDLPGVGENLQDRYE